eukprot:COSAG01_NODE_783_length_13630_cov_5.556459_13_plen_84_part_00
MCACACINSPAADDERRAILRTLVMASGGTGLMHESYWLQNSSVYTRIWFGAAVCVSVERGVSVEWHGLCMGLCAPLWSASWQ